MATKQELQLEILNLEYSRFVKDQVLTEVQLNEIIDFFEDQHRITRTCLIGTGIVCGLHLRHNPKSISLSQGVAITTDGDLLRMSATSFKYFAEYIQPDNGHYDPFYYKQGTEEKAVRLFQLITDEEKEKNTSLEIFNLEDLDSKINNWVAVLYLEYYLKEAEKCTPTNCDNLGRRQVAKPKVLLLSKEDMDKVIRLDTGEVIGDDIYLKYHEAYDKYFTFPVIRPKRVIMNKFNTLQGNALAGAYFTAAKDGSTALADTILGLYEAFKFLVDRDHSVNIKNLLQKLNTNLNSASNALYAQYTYDFYKDIVIAYNELRDILYNVAFECIPNLYAFPKHIMLGEPNIDYGPQPPAYRHQFYPSPAVSRHKTEVNVAIGMLDRMKLMIENFNPKEVDAIRITPSKDYDQPLEDRAIPFYYQNPDLLSQKWNYRKTLKANEKLNLSYNANLYAPPVTDETMNPLDYSIDEYNFFRIEGHIGKDYKIALKQLDDLKSQKGVPIDIVAVRLGDVKLSDINLDDFACQFEDLTTMLRAFQVEMNCILGDGSSFFSGFTAKPATPHINLQRYIAAEGQPQWNINETFIKDASKAASAGLKNVAAENIGKAAAGNVKETISDSSRATIFELNPEIDFCDRFINPVYEINRTVKIKIDDNPDSFGKYYLKAMETENLSVDEFVEKARSFASDDLELNSLNEDQRYVVFEYPTQIIGHLNFMQRFVPGSIGDITQKYVSDYRNFSQSFCRRLVIMRTRLEKFFRTGDYISQGYESAYMNMIDRLEKLCCGNEKLEVVMREIERRKAEILRNLSFARYADQHPGLEHKAGSHRGGTFVIVYASAPKSDQVQPAFSNLTFGRSASGRIAGMSRESMGTHYNDIDSFALYVVSNDEKINREDELGVFFANNNIERGSAYSEYVIKELNTRIAGISKIICKEISQPAANIVIADFCLPYLCCSDCPPVAFIIPKEKEVAEEKVSLSLDKNLVCSNSDPLKFTVVPADGVVDAVDPGFTGTIEKGADGSTFFNPQKVTEGQFGTSVTFTVNGKPSDCAIVVKSPIILGLDFKLNDTEADNFDVVFINNTDEVKFGKQTYLWKFNDGSPDVTKTDTSEFTVTFSKKKLLDQNIGVIVVTVTVLNDPCNSAGTLSIEVPKGEVVNECPEMVADIIETKLKELTSPEFVKRVEKVNNPEVQAIYETAVGLLKSSLKILNDPARKLKIIMKIDDTLRQIYLFKIDSTDPDLPRILEELLRDLLMLILNLVRCDDKINDEIVRIIISNIGMFIELQNQLIEKYPQLDLDNILEIDVIDYAKNFVSQDDHIIGILKALLESLGKFPS